jgi:hypothetical protein
MQSTKLAVDDGPHSSGGLLLHGWAVSTFIEAFGRCRHVRAAKPSFSAAPSR